MHVVNEEVGMEDEEEKVQKRTSGNNSIQIVKDCTSQII